MQFYTGRIREWGRNRLAPGLLQPAEWRVAPTTDHHKQLPSAPLTRAMPLGAPARSAVAARRAGRRPSGPGHPVGRRAGDGRATACRARGLGQRRNSITVLRILKGNGQGQSASAEKRAQSCLRVAAYPPHSKQRRRILPSRTSYSPQNTSSKPSSAPFAAQAHTINETGSDLTTACWRLHAYIANLLVASLRAAMEERPSWSSRPVSSRSVGVAEKFPSGFDVGVEGMALACSKLSP
jgi:hypothetical protein